MACQNHDTRIAASVPWVKGAGIRNLEMMADCREKSRHAHNGSPICKYPPVYFPEMKN
jgi:hypothetical protein